MPAKTYSKDGGRNPNRPPDEGDARNEGGGRGNGGRGDGNRGNGGRGDGGRGDGGRGDGGRGRGNQGSTDNRSLKNDIDALSVTVDNVREQIFSEQEPNKVDNAKKNSMVNTLRDQLTAMEKRVKAFKDEKAGELADTVINKLMPTLVNDIYEEIIGHPKCCKSWVRSKVFEAYHHIGSQRNGPHFKRILNHLNAIGTEDFSAHPNESDTQFEIAYYHLFTLNQLYHNSILGRYTRRAVGQLLEYYNRVARDAPPPDWSGEDGGSGV